jgi:hypothetical protein
LTAESPNPEEFGTDFWASVEEKAHAISALPVYMVLPVREGSEARAEQLPGAIPAIEQDAQSRDAQAADVSPEPPEDAALQPLERPLPATPQSGRITCVSSVLLSGGGNRRRPDLGRPSGGPLSLEREVLSPCSPQPSAALTTGMGGFDVGFHSGTKARGGLKRMARQYDAAKVVLVLLLVPLILVGLASTRELLLSWAHRISSAERHLLAQPLEGGLALEVSPNAARTAFTGDLLIRLDNWGRPFLLSRGSRLLAVWCLSPKGESFELRSVTEAKSVRKPWETRRAHPPKPSCTHGEDRDLERRSRASFMTHNPRRPGAASARAAITGAK